MSVLIGSNVSLRPYNTFGIDANAQHFTVAKSVDALKESLAWAQQQNVETLVVGGGSNMLFTKDVHGLGINNPLEGV